MQQFAFSRTEQGIRERALERQRREAEQARQAFLDRYRYTSEFQTSASLRFSLKDRWADQPKIIKSKFQRIEERVHSSEQLAIISSATPSQNGQRPSTAGGAA